MEAALPQAMTPVPVRWFRSSSLKGEVRRGRGFLAAAVNPIPAPSFPLKGREGAANSDI
jgi:hypothetical protein